MKLSISKKFAKRSIKCLALFAPLAYLFGTMFTYLLGAHEGVDFDVLGFGDTSSVTRVDVGSFTNYYRIDDDGNLNNSTRWSYTTSYYPVGSYNAIDFDSTLTFNVQSIFSLCVYDSNYNFLTQHYYYGDSIKWVRFDLDSSYYLRFQYRSFLPDDGDYSMTFSYFDLSDVSKDNVLSNFFSSDNFLVHWGLNCISDNPKGFAPFGAFFKLLDDNILHLSDSQIGLMAYGYLYYCLHVLIACLAFDIVAFIPLFVQRVQDRLGGKEDD